ncbi:MAG: hypothetical protein IIX59_03710 [Alistipes sp.]|nr:hypothetical protein [Alistipes sp.]MBQ2419498.1 hypothetical protein [Alistipes sp.]
METTFHYYAFISYSTKDSKWAKWLRQSISYYHIPSSGEKSSASKQHPCICSWDSLDQTTHSYDCNVVDTTIKLAYEQLSSK